MDNNWADAASFQSRLAAIFSAGGLRAGKRAAAVMSLIQSARLNGLDPWVYLKDVLERLPTHPAHRAADLLPHRWSATASV